MACNWVLKAEQPGVKRQSLMRPAWMLGQFGFVARVTEHRMASLSKMNTNLVTSPRFEPDLHERRAVEVSDDAIVRDSKLPD